MALPFVTFDVPSHPIPLVTLIGNYEQTFTCKEPVVSVNNITVVFGHDYGFALFISVVQHLVCNLKFIVQFRRVYEHDEKSLSLDIYTPNEDQLAKFDLVTISQIFLVEIIGGLKTSKDTSMFSIVKLCDIQTWLLLLLLAIITAVLIKELSLGCVSLVDSLCDMIKTLTIEPDLKSLNKHVLTGHPYHSEIKTLIMLWLFSTYFLVTTFQSVLLNTFFNVKAIPLVESLEDILHMEELSIAMRTETSEAIGNDSTLTTGLFEEFSLRRDNYQNNFNFSFDTKLILLDTILFKDIVEGKAVLLANSDLARRFNNLYISETNLFSISSTKYYPRFGSFIMLKKQLFRPEIKFIFTQIIENGLDIHHDMIENILKTLHLRSVYKDNMNKILKSLEISFDSFDKIGLDEMFRNDFILLICGFIFSTMVYLIEIIYDDNQIKTKRHHCNKFQANMSDYPFNKIKIIYL